MSGTTAALHIECVSGGRGCVLVAERLARERRQRALAARATAAGTRASRALHFRLLAHGLPLGARRPNPLLRRDLRAAQDGPRAFDALH